VTVTNNRKGQRLVNIVQWSSQWCGKLLLSGVTQESDMKAVMQGTSNLW